MFTQRDIAQITAHGLSSAAVEAQLEDFRRGFPFLSIDRAAVVGDGILRLNADLQQRFIHLFRDARCGLRIEKFVPASGAATRMFKDMFAYVESGQENSSAREVAENIDRFAFADELKRIPGATADSKALIRAILSPEGMGYGAAPKALILFHSYPEGNRTALEEHLCEGALYAPGLNGRVSIHFTVSPEHQIGFEQLVLRVLERYEAAYGVTYSISYSQQQSSTDTIAVDTNNEPFREEDGSLLFRPAGHGALLKNLESIDADLIFVKNIDNVTTDARKGDTVHYKEVLAGQLIHLRQCCYSYLHALDKGESNTKEIVSFLENELAQKLPVGFDALNAEDKNRWLHERLNRPLRVCGMVRNEGEPGGGPFWVKEADGAVSLQIAESSQIAPEQKGLMDSATHFNPVDLVCSTVDYKGGKFDLVRFTDPTTGFISEKSKSGRPLRALELPGLWNGAMARWNTVFTEVPGTVFTPVKTINDLLRPEHQPGGETI